MNATSRSLFLSGLAVAALSVGLSVGGAKPALACGSTNYVGEVCYFAENYCPVGTLVAAGQSVSMSTYQTLFALIGLTYGGDGKTTFALPNLVGRMVVGSQPTQPLGVATGKNTVTLSSAQMPVHSHPIALTSPLTGVSGGVPFNTASPPTTTLTNFANGATVYPTNVYTATAPATGAVATLPVQGQASVTLEGNTGSTGYPAPLSVTFQSPALKMMPCIFYEGLFPVRPSN
ncbi:MAG: hypothetical protein FD119_3940 [Stygiobacter sp.]|nr:MAG: hypothetical protein FD119_3940 [Stygiobacter sp.]